MTKKIIRHLSIFLVNHVFCGTKYYPIKRRLMRLAGHRIGRGTNIVGPVYCTGRLIVGAGSHLGKNLRINGNGSVVIGDNCDIAPEVTFMTGGHKIGKASRRAGKGESYCIRVGSGTWIGARSSVVRSVRIGSGCVIAACSCVTKNLADNGLYGGVPARLIRRLDSDVQDTKK